MSILPIILIAENATTLNRHNKTYITPIGLTVELVLNPAVIDTITKQIKSIRLSILLTRSLRYIYDIPAVTIGMRFCVNWIKPSGIRAER